MNEEIKELQKEVVASVQSEIKKTSDELSGAIERIDHEIKLYGEASNDAKSILTELSEKQEAAEIRMGELEQLAVRNSSQAVEAKTLGDIFINDEGFKEYAQKNYHRGSSVPLQLKDITSDAASAGDGIWSFRDPNIVSDPYRPLAIRDIIPTVPVDSNLVEWVRTNVRTNNATVVSETGIKPKSELTYDRVQTAVTKIAHYFKTSSEVLNDFKRLRAEINNEGFEMLRQVEEDQLIAGDGTGNNLLGLIPQATDFNPVATQSGDTVIDTIRRAILQVRQSYYSATAILVNPADWADIELLKDGENRYLFSGNASSGASNRMWGLPVVQVDSLTEGEFMVGAFSTAATIYDRMNPTMMISTENEDDFITNMVSILFEERLALAVKRPLAFIHGNTDGAS